MAKMFYNLEEAAQVLKKTPDEVRDLASRGKLQQFRDREKLMFKREQVDAMAQTGPEDSGSAISLADGGSGSGLSLDTGSGSSLSLADESSGLGSGSGTLKMKDKTGDTDAVGLDATMAAPKNKKEDPRQATGVSVFDVGEVEQADPMAQTQVNQSSASEEDLALESVGSGSGLLDLTRESDDTSLGAELLDEIYPANQESDTKVETVGDASSSALTAAGATIASAATVTDSGTVDTGSGSSSSLAGSGPSMEAADALADAPAITPGPMEYAGPVEVYDPSGSAMSNGFLGVAMFALVVGMIVAVFAVNGVDSAVVKAVGESSQTVMIYGGALLLLSFVCGIGGLFVGKVMSR